MSDDYYGYAPTPTYGSPYASDDYNVGAAPEFSETRWGDHSSRTMNIEVMYRMVERESDEHAMATSMAWWRIQQLLEHTKERLQRHAEALSAKWNSDAGRMFMRHVGGTLYSLDEWAKVAASNKRAVDAVIRPISKAQSDMRTVWDDYQRRKSQNAANRQENKDSTFTGIENWLEDVKDDDEIMDEFHQRAVNAIKPLADAYVDAYIHNVTRGGTFKGPTTVNARYIEEHMPKPGAGPGGRGARPAAPAGRKPSQPAPTPPTVKPPTAPPVRPGDTQGPSLAGTKAPAPTQPTVPQVRTPGGPSTPPPTAPVVAPPGRPAGTGPTSRSAAGPRPPAPSRPTLPGTGGPGGGAGGGGRPPAPSRPNLQGSQGSSGGSRAPGGGPGSRSQRPSLPGSTRAGEPGSSGRPTAPGGARRPGGAPNAPSSKTSLPGSTASRPGAPSTPGGGQPPRANLSGKGSTGAPPRPGPGRPGTGEPGTGARPPHGAGGRPSLPGRSLPTAGGAAQQLTGKGGSPGPSLGGRRGNPEQSDQAQWVGKSQGSQHGWDPSDEEEMWAIDSTAVGAVETPEEQAPQQQGRVLGNG